MPRLAFSWRPRVSSGSVVLANVEQPAISPKKKERKKEREREREREIKREREKERKKAPNP